jgi:hypothetical protein
MEIVDNVQRMLDNKMEAVRVSLTCSWLNKFCLLSILLLEISLLLQFSMNKLVFVRVESPKMNKCTEFFFLG